MKCTHLVRSFWALLLFVQTGVASDRSDLLKLVERTLEQPLPAPARDNSTGGLAWSDSYAMQGYVEILAATGDERFAERMIRHADLILAVTDEKLGRKDEYRNQTCPAWGSSKYSDKKNYVWAVHTGMLASPMARFAAVVHGNEKLKSRFTSQADRLLAAAERAAAVHDRDYRQGPAPDEGYLYCFFLKKHLPLNQQNALVQTWIALDEANANSRYRDKIQRLAQFFKRRIRLEDDNCYVWDYWPPVENAGTKAEDISHAAINVNLAALLFERGIVFDRRDIDRFANTFTKRVFPSIDQVADTVDGNGRGRYERSVLRWGRLARTSPLARSRLAQYAAKLEAPLAPPDFLGVAYLISAMMDE